VYIFYVLYKEKAGWTKSIFQIYPF